MAWKRAVRAPLASAQKIRVGVKQRGVICRRERVGCCAIQWWREGTRWSVPNTVPNLLRVSGFNGFDDFYDLIEINNYRVSNE